MSKEDEGVEVTISTEYGRIRLEFKKPLQWISMNYIQAIGLADIIIKKAKELEPGWKN